MDELEGVFDNALQVWAQSGCIGKYDAKSINSTVTVLPNYFGPTVSQKLIWEYLMGRPICRVIFHAVTGAQRGLVCGQTQDGLHCPHPACAFEAEIEAHNQPGLAVNNQIDRWLSDNFVDVVF